MGSCQNLSILYFWTRPFIPLQRNNSCFAAYLLRNQIENFFRDLTEPLSKKMHNKWREVVPGKKKYAKRRRETAMRGGRWEKTGGYWWSWGGGGGWWPATVGKIQMFKVADFKWMLCSTSRSSSWVKNGSESDAIRRPRAASFSMTYIDVICCPRVKVTTRGKNEMEVWLTISLAIANAWRRKGLLTLGLARLFLNYNHTVVADHGLSDKVPIFLIIYLFILIRSR